MPAGSLAYRRKSLVIAVLTAVGRRQMGCLQFGSLLYLLFRMTAEGRAVDEKLDTLQER
jgi:hypothetical protein